MNEENERLSNADTDDSSSPDMEDFDYIEEPTEQRTFEENVVAGLNQPEIRNRKSSGSAKKVTFDENMPRRDSDTPPIEPDAKPGDIAEFMDVPESSIIPFLLKQTVAMRLFVVFLQFIFNWWDFSTDAFKGVPTPRDEFSFIDIFLRRLFDGFKRWDAVHFLHVAEHGYTWEQNLAFFPLFPYLIRFLSKFWATPLLYLKVLHISTVHMLTAIAMNFVLFQIAGLLLYKIVLNVSESRKQAVIAVLLFSVNPASIFFSAVYSESLYCCLTFLGILMLLESRGGSNVKYVVAIIAFSLSYTTRSNGFLNLGYVIWFSFIDFLFKKSYNGKWYFNLHKSISTIVLFATSFIVKIFLAVIIVTYPIRMHDKQQAARFCSDSAPKVASRVIDFADEHGFNIVGKRSTIDWCNANSLFFPSFYSTIQKKYWDVGMFAYWKIAKIPCFLMAAPAFFIIGMGIVMTWKMTRKYSSIYTFLLDRGGYLAFTLHAWVMGIGALFLYNSEVLTRILFSSSPFAYLVISKWMSERTPMVRLSDLYSPSRLPFLSNFCWKGKAEAALFVYFMTYYITGTMWHVTWLPFT